MRVLFLAPQPYFTERGTPLAINLLLKVLSERGEKIDFVTYHLGEDVEYENIRIYRIINLPFIRSVPPGISFRKIICDFFLFWKTIGLLLKYRYHIIHAVEESVLIAMLIKKIWGIEYVYDMDSRLPRQLMDRYSFLEPFSSFLYYMERKAIRNAMTIVPVSDALVEEVEIYEPNKVIVLRDVSLLGESGWERNETIRGQMNFYGVLVMYVGNLECYQGIDLLLESFALVIARSESINLAIIGGKEKDVHKYQEKSRKLGIGSRVRFFGPRPVKNLGSYLSEADILVSPRILGDNTPMKVYSYLESGKAIIATNLRTHTQVLDEGVALLSEPNPISFAEGMLLLAEDEDLREKLGRRGKELVAKKYNFDNFRTSVNIIYDSITPVQVH
jgi:glycosyltransferase involved in cell wall biosynthesis